MTAEDWHAQQHAHRHGLALAHDSMPNISHGMLEDMLRMFGR